MWPVGRRRIRGFALASIVTALALQTGLARATNDPLWFEQWAPVQIHAPDAWDKGVTGAGVIVGVVDTGIDFGHPELAGKVVASADCENGPCHEGAGVAQDNNNHGTHVSGIIAAQANNGEGIAGIAYNARLVVAKALDENGGGNTGDVAAGIDWAVQKGAQVINLSLGPETLAGPVGQVLFPGAPSDIQRAIEDAYHAGRVVVLASGNSNTGLPILTGSQNYGSLHAIVVGATDQSGQPACYSSPLGNAAWSIVAPGGGQSCAGGDGIVSTVRMPPANPTPYAKMSGTSMATPHVSAVVAMLLSQGLSAQQAIDRVLSTADPVSSCACRGRLNAGAAVGAPATPPVNNTQTYPNQQPDQSGSSGQQPGSPPQQGQPGTSPQQPNPDQPSQQPVLTLRPVEPTPGPTPSPSPAPPQPAPYQPGPPPPPPPTFAPQPIAPAPPPENPTPVVAPEPPPPTSALPPAVAAAEPPTTITAAPPPLPKELVNVPPVADTTTTSSTTTTTVASEQPAARAPETSRALYDNRSSGGSTAEALMAATLLLGVAAAGFGLTRKPPPPDLL